MVFPRRRWQLRNLGLSAIGASLLLALAILSLDLNWIWQGDVEPATITLAALLLLVVGLLIAGGAQIGRAYRAGHRDDVLPGVTYAFAVRDQRVIFPALRLRPGTHWPASDTTIGTAASWGRKLITLEAPGHRPRSFAAADLRADLAEIRAALTAADASQPAATGDWFQFDLSDWAREAALAQVTPIRRARVGLIVPGSLFLSAGALYLAGSAIRGDLGADLADLVAVGLVAVGTAALLLARRARRRQQVEEQQSLLMEAMPYGFAIRDGQVEYPDRMGRVAESWPLSETEIRYVDQGESGLVLTCPGRNPRPFLAGGLKLSTRTVIGLVEAFQAEARPSKSASSDHY